MAVIFVCAMVFDITNKYENYNIDNNEITIDFGLITCFDCHNLIDTFGYCKCIM